MEIDALLGCFIRTNKNDDNDNENNSDRYNENAADYSNNR